MKFYNFILALNAIVFAVGLIFLIMFNGTNIIEWGMVYAFFLYAESKLFKALSK